MIHQFSFASSQFWWLSFQLLAVFPIPFFPTFYYFCFQFFFFFSEWRKAERGNLFSYLLRFDFCCVSYMFVAGEKFILIILLHITTYRIIDPYSWSVFHKHDTIICIRVSLIWVRICYDNLDWSTPCACFDWIKKKNTRKVFCSMWTHIFLLFGNEQAKNNIKQQQ